MSENHSEDAPQPGYWRTDPAEDVLSDLQALCFALGAARRNNRAWKWAILAADMLVQSALLIFNSGSTNIGAYERKDRERMWAWMDEGSRNGEPAPAEPLRVENLHGLLRLATGPHFFRGSPPLALPASLVSQVQKMHSAVRNDLTHFKSVSWSIELAGVPAWITAALDISEAALTQSDTHWASEDEQEEELVHLLAVARRRLSLVDVHAPSGQKANCP
jgi:hypothetical protein